MSVGADGSALGASILSDDWFDQCGFTIVSTRTVYALRDRPAFQNAIRRRHQQIGPAIFEPSVEVRSEHGKVVTGIGTNPGEAFRLRMEPTVGRASTSHTAAWLPRDDQPLLQRQRSSLDAVIHSPD